MRRVGITKYDASVRQSEQLQPEVAQGTILFGYHVQGTKLMDEKVPEKENLDDK